MVKNAEKGLLRLAFRRMTGQRRNENKHFGAILAQSVANAMETLIMVGGFIILFSVIVKAAEIMGIIDFAAGFAVSVLNLDSGSLPMMRSAAAGILEIANGTRLLSENADHLRPALIIAAGIISWGGLSIHAQTIGFIKKTGADINCGFYMLCKAAHGILAAAVGFVIYPLFSGGINESVVPAGIFEGGYAPVSVEAPGLFGNFTRSFRQLFVFIIVLAVSVLIAGIASAISRGIKAKRPFA